MHIDKDKLLKFHKLTGFEKYFYLKSFMLNFVIFIFDGVEVGAIPSDDQLSLLELLRRPYVVWGIEPRSAVCKNSLLKFCIISLEKAILFNQGLKRNAGIMAFAMHVINPGSVPTVHGS